MARNKDSVIDDNSCRRLKSAEGRKLSGGSIFVPESGKTIIEELFKTYKIEHDRIRVWGF